MGGKQAQALLAALIAWPLAAQTYEPVLLAPQIMGSPQTMTALNGGDDSTRLVQLGFPFEYYGQTFTSAWVSTNGFVSFQSPAHLCCNGYPMEQAQRNTIYAYWTDLISGDNPYYRSDGSSALFGWYNTYEYGTQNKNTFEINLSADGSIQFNYGALGNTYHLVSAGITGPTATDNIQLFYGQNVQNLQNQSGMLAVPPPPEPEPVVVPPAAIDPAPDVAPDPTQAVQVETTQEVVAEEPVQETTQEDVAAETAAAAEEAAADAVVAEEVAVEDAPVQTQEAQAEASADKPLSPDELAALAVDAPPIDAGTEEAVKPAEQAPAEATTEAVKADQQQQAQQSSTSSEQTIVVAETRRDRNVEFFQREAIEDADLFPRETVLEASVQNVAFLAQADAQYVQQVGEQTTTETAAQTYSILPVEGPTFANAPTTGMWTDSEPVWTDGAPQQTADQTPAVATANADASPSGQAQQMELLGMSMQREMAVDEPKDIGDVNSQDSETMTQLAAVPAGYSSYTQARIPDAPFYQPRDIYKGRRIPDANLALYRMMSGQDARWNDMVEDQYER